jgi:hypothetical protein
MLRGISREGVDQRVREAAEIPGILTLSESQVQANLRQQEVACFDGSIFSATDTNDALVKRNLFTPLHCKITKMRGEATFYGTAKTHGR